MRLIFRISMCVYNIDIYMTRAARIMVWVKVVYMYISLSLGTTISIDSNPDEPGEGICYREVYRAQFGCLMWDIPAF